MIQETLVDENPTVSSYKASLSHYYYVLGHRYRDTNQQKESLASLKKIVEIRKRLVDENPTVPGYKSSLATSCNALAWRLATCPDKQFRDARHAVSYAEQAVELAPEQGNNWGTLGTALYRNGDYQGAIEALLKSVRMLKGQFYIHNGFFLAMAHQQLGNEDQARNIYNRAVEWMHKNKPNDEELLRFRAEAQQLLGLPAVAEKPEVRDQESEARSQQTGVSRQESRIRKQGTEPGHFSPDRGGIV